MTNMARATNKKIWMNPPRVVEVATPSSQRTHKITRIVQSMKFQSHKKALHTALVAHLKSVTEISWMTHSKG